jgi:hypothetical protein
MLEIDETKRADCMEVHRSLSEYYERCLKDTRYGVDILSIFEEPTLSSQPSALPLTITSHSRDTTVDTNSQPETWSAVSTNTPATARSSTISALTKSSNKSYATPHTSVPSGSSSTHFQKSHERALAGIQEEEAQTLMDNKAQVSLTEELLQPYDNISLVSQDITQYSPDQRDDVILRFTQEMLKRLPGDFNYAVVNETSHQQLLYHLRLSLKAFTEAVALYTSDQAYCRGIRMIRRLRQEIASKIHDEILSLNRAVESSRGVVALSQHLPPMTREKKVQDLTARIDPLIITDSQSADIRQEISELTPQLYALRSSSQTNSSSTTNLFNPLEEELPDNMRTNLYGNSVNPAEIMDYLARQSAFDHLIHETERLFERYHGQKMDLIRRRTSLALRRHPGDNQRFSARFFVDWDLGEFLIKNYDTGFGQKLDRILAITGGSETAIMCTVGEYMAWCWPPYSTQLLHAIETVLCSSNSEQTRYLTSIPGATNSTLDIPMSQCITVDSTLKQFDIEGTEDFVISIAQQLSWLAAVCQEKTTTLTHAYIGFSQVISRPNAIFDIDVKLETPSTLESGSCWNRLVGPAVVVNGFPIRERQPEYQGLEVSISVMASLAGLPQAVTFGGGFVFKGPYHALVPVEGSSEFIQWHLVDTYPKRLKWTDIDKSCPRRLKKNTGGDAFWQTRSFLGWCPCVIELLGMKYTIYHYCLTASLPY